MQTHAAIAKTNQSIYSIFHISQRDPLKIMIARLNIEDVLALRLVCKELKNLIDSLNITEIVQANERHKVKIKMIQTQFIDEYYNAMRELFYTQSTADKQNEYFENMEINITANIETLEAFRKLVKHMATIKEEKPLDAIMNQLLLRKILLTQIKKIKSIDEYREFVDLVNKALRDKNITDDIYKELVKPTENTAEKIYDSPKKLFRLASLGPALHGILGSISFISMVIIAVQPGNLDECQIAFTESNVLACQEGIDKTLLRNYLFTLAISAMIGFAVKAGAQLCTMGANFYLLDTHHQFTLLPKLSLNQPISVTNKLAYTLWKASEYLHLPLFLAGGYYTAEIFANRMLSLNANDCRNENNNASPLLDNDCIQNQVSEREHDLTRLVAPQGFLLAVSTIAVCILLCKLIQAFFDGIDNKYHQHRLFLPKNRAQAEVQIPQSSVKSSEVKIDILEETIELPEQSASNHLKIGSNKRS